MQDTAIRLLSGDARRQTQLFLMFLSDGAPSDHTELACPHGVRVWQPDYSGNVMPSGKPMLQNCRFSSACRSNVRKAVETACVKRIQQLGDLLGRDRVYVGTVAFGPPSEDYAVLQAMSAMMPRSSFQVRGHKVEVELVLDWRSGC